MTYCFDLDGTLCTDTQGEYEKALPFPDMVVEVNRLRTEGHRVLIFTARGAGTGIDWHAETERQLAVWGVGYDRIYFGKPPADVYVDDKAVNVTEFRLARFGSLGHGVSPALFPPFPYEKE